jgi:tetratricopeptide (TPR) repeat protein
MEEGESNILSPTESSSNILSIEGGDRLMKEIDQAVTSQDYALAVKKLQQARQVYNQLSSLYQQLNSSFTGIDISAADSHRKNALATAQKRDEATYQLALVYRAQNQPELAIPLLVQIITSQNPTRELGTKAYQQLFELGFVKTPFPSQGKK